MARMQAHPLFLWGIANILVLLAIIVLHPFIPVQHVFRLHFISVAMWLIVTWASNRAPLRVPAPIGILLAMALWFYVCTLMAQGSVFRFVGVLDNGLYEWPWLAMNFLMGSSLAYFAPQSRSIVAKIVVGIALASSIMAMLQFVGIGPAISLGARFMTRELSAGVEAEDAAVRAFGILRVGQGAMLSVVAAMILTAPLLWRKIPWWHVGLAAFILFGGLLGQVRSFMPMLAVAYLAMTGLLLYRYGGVSRIVTFFLCVIMLIPVAIAVPRMQYITELVNPTGDGSNTFTYRREQLWPQVSTILRERPWTGIGYEPQLFGAGGPTTRRTSGLTVDGGYHLALGVGGYPALALLILFLASAIVVVVRGTAQARGDSHRMPLLAGMCIVVFSLPLLTAFGHVAYGQNFSGLTYLIAGLCMASAPALAEASSRQELMTFARRTVRRSSAKPLVPVRKADGPE